MLHKTKPWILPRLSPTYFSLLIAILLVVMYNASFWRHFFQVVPLVSLRNGLFLVSCFLVMAAVLKFFLSLVAFKPLQKPFIMALCLVSAFCTYFLSEYGGAFDQSMVQNVLESNSTELGEYFTLKVVLYALVLGILPAWWVTHLPVSYPRLKKQLFTMLFSMMATALIVIINLSIFYHDYRSLLQQHSKLPLLVNPLNYLFAVPAYLLQKTDAPSQLIPIATDAKMLMPATDTEKPLTDVTSTTALSTPTLATAEKKILILVIGEAARADHFALNGYARDTTPKLSAQNILNFSQVSACATATAVAIPCMFSIFDRLDFDSNHAKRYENIIDVLHKVGVNLHWRDNNGGCKGTCDRAEYEDVSKLDNPKLCKQQDCLDEVLLQDLDAILDKPADHQLIILHQKGSHGPAYFKRTPQEFKKFLPECASSQLKSCSLASIVNAYDNSLLYTDYLLDQLIEQLKQRPNTQSALLYLSDHGESLGENNLYLHGLPYHLSPAAQTHIPMLMWLSPAIQNAQISENCVRKKLTTPYSHDGLFHMLLSFFQVNTQAYRADLDWLGGCHQPHRT